MSVKRTIKQPLKQSLKSGISGASGSADITLAGLTFDQNLTLSGVTDPHDVWVSSDGSNMLLVGEQSGGTKEMRSYELSTPFDLSTAGTASVKAVTNSVYSCMWKPDGTEAFIFNGPNARMEQWTASTPFSIGTATESTADRVPHGQTSGAYWEFKATKNGRYFIKVTHGTYSTNGIFIRYTLSTPWDGSTAVQDGNFINLGPELYSIGFLGDVFGADFSVEGDYCLVIYIAAQTYMVLYRLDIPYDLTTMRKVDDVVLPPEVSSSRGCHLNMEEKLIFLPDRNSPEGIRRFSFTG